MSLVSMLGPTPDWIVGVSALELCLKDCSWVDQKVLNLYPWDAGTDSGITYVSANSATIPREKIRRITSSYPSDPKSPFYDPTGQPMKPLAQLTVTRQRVYEKSCSDTNLLRQDPPTVLQAEDFGADRPECQVSEWSSYTPCSVTCWKGLRKRTRTYLMPMKAQMMRCERQLEEREMCAAPVPECPGGNTNNNLFSNEYVVDDFDHSICTTSEWSSWTACSVTCGKGHRMRNRRYLDRMGRKKCDKELTEKQMCVADVPECEGQPENEIISPECAVTQWSDFSPCSVTCGQGYTVRTRYYLVPTANQADCDVRTMEKRPCVGERNDCTIDPAEAEEVCMQERLPGPCRGFFPRWYFDKDRQMCFPFTYGGCRGNRNKFQTYDECARMCEFNREAMINPDQSVGTPTEDSQPPPHTGENIPGLEVWNQVGRVDCMVTPWSEWSPCSITCGKGQKLRRRMIKVQAQHGGKRCPKKLVRRRKCRKPKCNRGFKGLKSMSQRREMPPPFKPYSPASQVPYDPNEDYIAPALYNPPPPPPLDDSQGNEEDTDFEEEDDGTKVDCVMGEWGPWSPCTHSCGPEALQQRSRNIITVPRNGGTECGNRYERRYCTLPPCPQPRLDSWGNDNKNPWMRFR
ncbi:spondin-1-like [Panulirus ornatus]|uniref:spondin-1-like n=1 Tax=Panulirus ornatus TaxID=150431 RepID=UPI003A84F7B6